MSTRSVFAASHGLRVSLSEAARVMDVEESLLLRFIGFGRFHAVQVDGEWEIPSREVLDAAMTSAFAEARSRFPGIMPMEAYEGDIEDFLTPPRCAACASAHWVTAPERDSCPA